MFKGIKMNRAKLMSGFAVLIALSVTLIGCSSGVDGAPGVDSLMGDHPAEWKKTHAKEFADVSRCETCHGSVTDRAKSGGISKVSCFNCHANGVKHTYNFALASQHGRGAAQLEPNDKPASMAGFAYCQKCHGDDFKGWGNAVSCFACHTKAPHPDKPWTGAHISTPSHTRTGSGNATVCYNCHRDGSNNSSLTVKPNPSNPVGTQPGCFNNTMCHSR